MKFIFRIILNEKIFLLIYWSKITLKILKFRSMKNLLLIILFASFSNIIKAQDTLTMRSGDNVIVKIIEVGSSEVKYKKIDNLNGPIFSILKSEVSMIQYENGSKDVFKEDMKIKQQSSVQLRSKDLSEVVTKLKRVRLTIFGVGALLMLYLTYNH
jgi:hypothetical protein